MNTTRIDAPDGAFVQASSFVPPGGGAEEVHLHATPAASGGFDEQLRSLEAVYARSLAALGLDGASAVFRRVFLSDAANQEHRVRDSRLGSGDGPLALSIVQQPPLPARKIALWAYHVKERAPLAKAPAPGGVALRRGALEHVWTAGLGGAGAPAAGSAAQTREAFDAYEGLLAERRTTLADGVVRTWLFVQGIDRNYQGMVDARRELFAARGLTADTHFIASTGIEGRCADHRRVVLCDAYAIAGLDPRQVDYLTAPRQLGPTAMYGVTFERGTRVRHGDRSHVLISGTASIDPEGRTVHVGDVRRQVERTLDNVDGLLADAGAAPEHVAQMLVYLRDPADVAAVEAAVSARAPSTPALYLLAPVCRPSWLVEIECIAIVPGAEPRWQPF